MNNRQSGVLLHPTSLPNSDGKLGVLDEQAWLFLDWMSKAGLSIWQMLPLTEPHDDLSPYQALSAFALNPSLLPDDWLSFYDDKGFSEYLKNQPHWLEDYVLFKNIRHHQNKRSWSEWPAELKNRNAKALETFSSKYKIELIQLKKQQYVLSKIWHQLKQDANKKGIQLFGDMPIFVSFDSADVWANPQQFRLDENLNPTVVTGVPPDYFSETGQRWGNPHYHWETMRSDNFSWWRKRVAEALGQFDLVRIDHFRGLEASWEIDSSEETAINGRWASAPGGELLAALKADFPDLPLIAEDLGIITEEVVALKNQFMLPGMAVLQFGFNGLPDNPHALNEQVEHSVAYTGTHDNDTTLGWFESLDEGTQSWILGQLTPVVDEKLKLTQLEANMPWPLVVAALDSVAQRVIVPMQDFLMLDSSHRMNIPGVPDGNWRWQFQWSQVSDDLAENIFTLLEQTNRI
ncbi:MAG: 4-alpha-glucanotransferase [Thiomicrorhabdus sp.]|nr:MAG: 4-alpha-glucanotransferase [Thiomicrorhabdus sp.]